MPDLKHSITTPLLHTLVYFNHNKHPTLPSDMKEFFTDYGGWYEIINHNAQDYITYDLKREDGTTITRIPNTWFDLEKKPDQPT